MPDLKSFLVLGATCCFATISGSAFAEEPVAEGPRRVEAEPPPEPPAVEELPLVEASPVRKNIGIALTAVGIVNMTAGTGVILSSFFEGGLSYGGMIMEISFGPGTASATWTF